MFDEILQQIKPLLIMENDIGGSRIKKQFRNLTSRVVEGFLSVAIQKEVIKEEPLGTFVLV